MQFGDLELARQEGCLTTPPPTPHIGMCTQQIRTDECGSKETHIAAPISSIVHAVRAHRILTQPHHGRQHGLHGSSPLRPCPNPAQTQAQRHTHM